MEWFIAGLVSLLVLSFAILRLIPKLMRFGPPIAKLTKQLEVLSRAQEAIPELAKMASALQDDPAIHELRRRQLLRAASKRKRTRERRLISRVS